MKKEIDLFDLLRGLGKKENYISEVFGNCDFLSEEIDILWKLIFNQYKMSEKSRESDYVGDAMCDFTDGKITKKKIIKILSSKK